MLISIWLFSYLFIIPVIFNFSYPQISLLYVPLFIISNYVQISQNLISLSLIPSHKKEKIHFWSCLELSFLDIIFMFLQSLIHRLKDYMVLSWDFEYHYIFLPRYYNVFCPQHLYPFFGPSLAYGYE